MYRLATIVVLLVLAAAALFLPNRTRQALGLHPMKTPSVAELDDPPAMNELEAGPFFKQRFTLEITVPRDMTLDEFLRLYNVRLPHVREEIQVQRGDQVLAPDTLLRKDDSLTITLVPPHEL